MDAISTPWAHQEIVQSLLETEQRFFINQSDSTRLQIICEELVHPLKGWWRREESHYNSMRMFRFLVKCNVAERLTAIGISKWRANINHLVERTSSISGAWLETHYDKIRSNLMAYEHEYQQMKDAAFLLELALWKTKIDESTQRDSGRMINWRILLLTRGGNAA